VVTATAKEHASASPALEVPIAFLNVMQICSEQTANRHVSTTPHVVTMADALGMVCVRVQPNTLQQAAMHVA
jgi:hypothetical protein